MDPAFYNGCEQAGYAMGVVLLWAFVVSGIIYAIVQLNKRPGQ